jgi:hypothetical protein
MATTADLPLVFLDFDDVLCVNRRYGGYDVFTLPRPEDLWQNLWHPPAVQVRELLVGEFHPRFIVTSSWLRMMDREGFESLFRLSGLASVAERLHEAWEAPQDRGATRLDAIVKWMRSHHRGEPFVVLDDHLSGTGLRGSEFDKARRVVLCRVDEGLHAGHLRRIRKALATPSESR